MKPSNKEFGSVSIILIVSSALLISCLVIETVLQWQIYQVRTINQKLERDSLDSAILNALSVKDVCTCQFKGQKIQSAEAPITIDNIRASCSSEKRAFLVSTSESNSYAVPVGQILITDIKSISGRTLYSANLSVRLKAGMGQPVLQPIQIPLLIGTGDVEGKSNGKVSWCEAGTSSGFLSSCPPGFTMIGSPGLYHSLCIESQAHDAGTFDDYRLACARIRPAGIAGATMCRVGTIYGACREGLIKLSNTSEWVGDISLADDLGTPASPLTLPAVAGNYHQQALGKPPEVFQNSTGLLIGPIDCKKMSSDVGLSSHPYRCCIYP